MHFIFINIFFQRCISAIACIVCLFCAFASIFLCFSIVLNQHHFNFFFFLNHIVLNHIVLNHNHFIILNNNSNSITILIILLTRFNFTSAI